VIAQLAQCAIVLAPVKKACGGGLSALGVPCPIIVALAVRLDREALSDRRAGRATMTRMGRDRGVRPGEARSRLACCAIGCDLGPSSAQSGQLIAASVRSLRHSRVMLAQSLPGGVTAGEFIRLIRRQGVSAHAVQGGHLSRDGQIFSSSCARGDN